MRYVISNWDAASTLFRDLVLGLISGVFQQKFSFMKISLSLFIAPLAQSLVVGAFVALSLLGVFIGVIGEFSILSADTGLRFEGQSDGVIEANEGHVLLTWSHDESVENIRLFMISPRDISSSDARRLLYEGKDSSYFISGLRSGEHVFVVESDGPSKGSAKVRVVVNYPASTLVYISLAMGTLLFLSLIVIIVKGNRLHANSPA